MDGGPPSSRPPSAFFCPPHSAWQLIAHSYALLDSQMANTRIERSKAKQRLEGRAIALAFRRPTAERLSGRRADCCGEFGSLSLKGGRTGGGRRRRESLGGFPVLPIYDCDETRRVDQVRRAVDAAPPPSCPPPFRGRDPTSSWRSNLRRLRSATVGRKSHMRLCWLKECKRTAFHARQSVCCESGH